MKRKPELIVALDVDTLEQAKGIIDTLSPVVDIYKVGSQLFTACGPAAVRFVMARGKKVFLDLKYHDIPNTVASAVKSAVGLAIGIGGSAADPTDGVFMLTMHTLGGFEMLKAAAKAVEEKSHELKVNRPLIVGITVLTSEVKKDNMADVVLKRAALAKEAGLDGVVASVEEAKLIHREFGDDFIIVTPGIRPAESTADDQKRTGTPGEAVANGSNFLVVGRPIIESANPLETARKITEDIRAF